MNLADGLSRQAAMQPCGLAVIRGREMCTFRTLDTAVWRLAAWLRRQGVGPGDVVGLTLVNQFNHLALSLALIRVGAVQLALPASDPPLMRAALARRVEVAVVLTDADPVGDLPCPVLQIAVQDVAAQRGQIDPSVRYDGSADTPYIVLAGSGTTGAPKLIQLAWRHHLARRALDASCIEFRPGQRYLHLSAIDFFDAKRGRLDCALLGLTNVFLESWSRKLVLQTCKLLGVDHLRMVPRQAAILTEGRSPRDGIELPHLRSLRVGGSTASEWLRSAVRATLASSLVVVYGTNEAGPVTFAPPSIQDAHPDSVGRPPEGVSLEVVDEEGRPLPAGEVGELRMRSPGMVAGFRGDPQATSLAFRDGWFYARDLGAFTEDGVLIYHGRADDMMIMDGINIFPREIEFALEEHPAVREALAFPIPDPVRQEVPAAAVVLAGSASEEELVTFCRDRLGRRAPSRVAIVPSFPDPVHGKILKRDLFRLFQTSEGQADSEAAPTYSGRVAGPGSSVGEAF